ncbi:MAG TPA: response regulator [Candidatus Udaeobacter sp.]|nr:response regulator [Candidatus Udaeobacter sp.]
MAEDKQFQILIIEDDAFLAEIYQKKFEMEGFKVILASNGEKGLADIKKKKPDVVLLEVLLPKMDGFAVLEAAKANSSTKNIPIILLTSLGQKDDVQRGLDSGAADYLIKTHFQPSEIVDKVLAVLPKK